MSRELKLFLVLVTCVYTDVTTKYLFLGEISMDKQTEESTLVLSEKDKSILYINMTLR